MSGISKLPPGNVWEIFDRITQVPRPSKKEGKIIEFLEEFAAEHKLECKKDKIGNVVIRRPASASHSGRPTVILQSHVDMVAEKNSDVPFDFDNDPIRAVETGDGWVKAEGTTLGADDGIGMAAALAVVTARDIELPAIEALFTVDEETGLTGASNLGGDMLTGKYLINLDSEKHGDIFIGCAGGIDTVATFVPKMEQVPDGHIFFRVDIRGLKGGHSGDDIEKGRANANKLMARFLYRATREAGPRLSAFDGGNLRNAIPREAFSVFAVPVKLASRLFEVSDGFTKEVKEEFAVAEPGMDIAVSEVEASQNIFSEEGQRKFINALQGLPNGVLAMSMLIPGLVETSSNLASVKSGGGGSIVVATSQRSSVDGARFDAAASVHSVFELAGAMVRHSEGYPGWKPDPSSRLLAVAKESYTALFGGEPRVKAIHAGLECGLFLEKYPYLEMISIGPTMEGVHSPDERIEIASVGKFWEFLLSILQNVE